jgi:NAD(P)-dependent dehydrogenase (short-subunit alcohol dehydrogenase family)
LAVAVVTGAASGLGQAAARRLAADGFDVAAVDIAAFDEPDAQLVHRCDLSSDKEVAGLADAVHERLGRCDVLVNSVGIYPFRTFEELTFAEWQRVFSVNLDSMFLTCKAFVPGMKQRAFGRIINVATNAYWVAVPLYTHYLASKGGVLGLTRGLASELGPHGITVNAVAPGLMRTPTTETSGHADFFDAAVATQSIPRLEVPEDVVGTISFLASLDAAFVTGQTIVVDGGAVRL